MSLIQCKDLSLGYEGRTIVENINFTVEQGDYLCVVGENGSGKSTLMRTILGLKSPISGKIELDSGLTSKQIGYLPQQTATQRDFPASVYEVVLSGCLGKCGILPIYKKEHKQLAAENKKRLGITDIADKCYRELSGGQQQRVLLARALCASTKLLVLDEPTAGLDPIASTELYESIRHLNENGLTVIMISHDISASIRYASHILHVSHTPLFFGKTEDYVSSEIGSFFIKSSNTTTKSYSDTILSKGGC